MLIFSIYYWILFELFIPNIFEALILIKNEQDLDSTDHTIYKTWKFIYEYLTNIDDDIRYQSRICILLNNYSLSNLSAFMDQTVYNEMKQAIKNIITDNGNVDPNIQSLVFNKQSVYMTLEFFRLTFFHFNFHISSHFLVHVP